MQARFGSCKMAGAFAATALFFVALSAPGTAVAQSYAPDAKESCLGCSLDGKTTPRTADGHPDLSGYWGGPTGGGGIRQFERSNDGSILFDFGVNPNATYGEGGCNDDSPRCVDPNEPAYKPEYMAKAKAIAATEYGGSTALDPQMDCKPLGIPRAGFGANIEIVQGPESIAVLYENAPYSLFRIIYMDGRPHPADLDTSYMGHSIGHWEGDTLVVDVVGLSDETWLAGGVGPAGRFKYANIHSDKEHVVERWTRDGNTLTYQATVDDPVMLTKPWVITQTLPHGGPVVSSDDGMLLESGAW